MPYTGAQSSSLYPHRKALRTAAVVSPAAIFHVPSPRAGIFAPLRRVRLGTTGVMSVGVRVDGK